MDVSPITVEFDVLHASRADCRLRPDVEKECELLKRRSAHQLKLVRRDSPQRIFQVTSVPVRRVNDYPEIRSSAFEFEFFELPCFHGRVNKRVVARRDESSRLEFPPRVRRPHSIRLARFQVSLACLQHGDRAHTSGSRRD